VGTEGVDWIWRRIDTFLGAVVVALAGAAASQGYAFMAQYIARLGAALNAAKAQLASVNSGLRYQLMSETVQKELKAEAEARVKTLQDAYHAIADANVLIKPFALWRRADPAMTEATWQSFVPALPQTSEAIVYVVIAMILGFALYEIAKLPLLLLAEPRQRKFRRRG
jgi:hypothetical protein